MSKNVFVTGCCGYIGSHTCVELLTAGYNVIGIDDFSNSSKDVLDNINIITGKDIDFYFGDVRDSKLLNRLFDTYDIDLVIDLAAFKSVGDSVKQPILYYDNNLVSLINLLKCMVGHNVKKFIFSSSATVYGMDNAMPVNEESAVGGTTNPYGTSKLFSEKILEDLYYSDHTWDICIFRYFNPVGAHISNLIGENPKGKVNNLMPHIVNVALNKEERIEIYGDDYDTIDGTGVRDYIHIMDLAKAHLKAIDKMSNDAFGLRIYNLGTGQGYSVLDLLRTFEKVNDVSLQYKIVNRREGDVAISFADSSKAKRELEWEAKYSLEDMCKTAFDFAKKVNDI